MVIPPWTGCVEKEKREQSSIHHTHTHRQKTECSHKKAAIVPTTTLDGSVVVGVVAANQEWDERTCVRTQTNKENAMLHSLSGV